MIMFFTSLLLAAVSSALFTIGIRRLINLRKPKVEICARCGFPYVSLHGLDCDSISHRAVLNVRFPELRSKNAKI